MVKRKKICMEVCESNWRQTFYMDTNGLLKGIWNCYECSSNATSGEKMYELCYNHYEENIVINEYGFFYNKFSCQKYDAVLKLNDDIYICEKNNRFGLKDGNCKTILPIVYEDIEPHNVEGWLFIISTSKGKFLFNLTNGTKTNIYENLIVEADHKDYIHHYYVLYKENNKYGLMSTNGKILLPPKYDRKRPGFNDYILYYLYKEHYYGLYIERGLLYGKFPLDEFDICFCVSGNGCFGYFFIIEKDGKLGILNSRGRCICEPCLDEIILYTPQTWSSGYYNSRVCVSFVIARTEHEFRLYNVESIKKTCIIDKCDDIHYKKAYIQGEGRDFIEYKKNGKIGYVTPKGIVISPEEYDEISVAFSYFIVKKNEKYGVLDVLGKEYIPCIYDNLYSKQNGAFVVIQNGKEETITDKSSQSDIHIPYDYFHPTYERYGGSYAQDVEGYSDDDIDTIFDGDPSAYWNID